jgi:anti-sigma factor RsiW
MIGRWTCRRWRRAVWSDVDGTLSAAPAARLRAHLDRCADCRAAHTQARRMDSLLRSEPLAEAPDDMDDRVVLGIAAGMGLADARHGSRGRAAGGAADRTDGSKGDPMGPWEWWILAGFLVFGVAITIWAVVVIVPALLASGAAAAPAAPAAQGGLVDSLSRGVALSSAATRTLTSFLQSPIGGPIASMIGVLALSLGIFRLAISRHGHGTGAHGRP